MKKCKVTNTFILACIALLYMELKAQNNTITRTEGHFVANLDFTPNSGVYNQRKNRISNPFFTPFFPQEFTANNITVKDMVKGAVLFMDWWTLFGEPVENYNFQWTSTGQYYISEYGGRLSTTVTRDRVAKYPDLLMRFDALKPLDIKFIIYWKHNNEAYKNRLHYTFSSSNINHSVSTSIATGLLFEPSGREPLSVPGIRQGKGLEFIDKKFDNYQHYSLNEEQKKSWLNEMNKANSITIDKYYVTEIRWPVEEMKAIAELYEAYEKGEKKPSPVEEVQAALSQIQGTQPYTRNDFWGETDEVKKDTLIYTRVNEKMGIVNGYGKTIVPASYKEISQNKQRNLFIAHTEGKRYQRPNERAYVQFPLHSDIYSAKGKLLLTYSNAYAQFVDSVNCILVRTPTGVTLVDAETIQTLFQVSYPNPYTEHQGYFHGITIPSDIVQTFPVSEYIGPNCGASNTRCGTISRTHVYGITKTKQVRFLGTYN